MSFLEINASITLIIRAITPIPLSRGPISGTHPMIQEMIQNAAHRTRNVTPFFMWPLINWPTPGRKMDTIPGRIKIPFLLFIKLLMISIQGSVNFTLCIYGNPGQLVHFWFCMLLSALPFIHNLGSMSSVCRASSAKIHT